MALAAAQMGADWEGAQEVAREAAVDEAVAVAPVAPGVVVTVLAEKTSFLASAAATASATTSGPRKVDTSQRRIVTWLYLYLIRVHSRCRNCRPISRWKFAL